VYGAGQSLHNPYTGILSIFSTRIRRGMNLPIFEDGLESRDFVHVNDVARAFRLALTSDAVNGRIINIGEGKPTSVMDIANLLVDKLDGKIRPEVTGQYRLGDIRHCYADLTQASTLLGYSPEISIDKGLDQFVDWVLSQPLPDDGLDKANEELRKRRMME
ncbi:MAG: NAD-dependent epimerase/dehydratase family protein, partial [Desulfobulbaceae bacterium]|nr:NAD-dependent epimerase/dehydratase family protein [Desulfobulbaceae bacterium]